ncbi:MAG: ankyrin repeat domain-containing protein [Candidatus Sericytochromatia bacterium]
MTNQNDIADDFNTFMNAIFDKDIDYLRKNIEFVQDINAIHERTNSTPLIMAIEAEDYEIINLLLQNGADINAQTHQGWTPLHVAIAEASDDYQRAMAENNYSEEITPPTEMIEYLLKLHPNLELKRFDGKTPAEMIPGWKKLHDLIEKEKQWQRENNSDKNAY